MNTTDDLIDQLASKGAAPSPDATRRFVAPLVVACLFCAAVLLAILGEPFASVDYYGIGPMAKKWGISLPLLLGSAFALHALGKPGRPARNRLAFLALPFLAVLVFLTIDFANAAGVFPGASWRSCLAAMLILGPVAFVAAISAVRWLAPTALRSAGMTSGLFGGAAAMTAYAPFCPELGMLYMVVFYCLPILALALAGWFLGPRLLRW